MDTKTSPICTHRTVRKGKVVSSIKMTGKTVVITGANTGLGFASALDLAGRGARVIMACRNLEKGAKAKEEIQMRSGSTDVVLMELDLASFQSIRTFAENFRKTESRLDVLMNNAGVVHWAQSKTKDGYETQFGTNHLGHFLLTNLLLDSLKKSAPSRIVTLSSVAHESKFGAKIYWDDMNLTKNYTPLKAYGQSKLMNVLFSRELGKRLQGTGVTTYCVHPGGVKTDLQRDIGKNPTPGFWDYFWKGLVGCIRLGWQSPEEGAQTQIYCSVASELEGISGKYYAECAVKRESRYARKDKNAVRLWEMSMIYTHLEKTI